MRTGNSSSVPVIFEALERRMMLSAAPVPAHHPHLHHAAVPAAHKPVAHHKTTQHAAHPKTTAAAGDPIYMNWNSQAIPGEVTATGFVADIELLSFQWGVGRGVTSAIGASSGKTSVSTLTITKTLDKSSPKLFDQALGGTPTPEVDILFAATTSDTQPYLQYTLNNVLVSGYSVSSGGDRPTESLTLNFSQVQVTYFAQGSSGQRTPVASQPWSITLIQGVPGS